jgi:hypothetical protein
VGNYYPQNKDPRLNEDLRLLFDAVYSIKDRIKGLKGTEVKPKETKGSGSSERSEQGTPSHTTINGLYVKATPPADQQVLTYVADQGDIEWGTISNQGGGVVMMVNGDFFASGGFLEFTVNGS